MVLDIPTTDEILQLRSPRAMVALADRATSRVQVFVANVLHQWFPDKAPYKGQGAVYVMKHSGRFPEKIREQNVAAEQLASQCMLAATRSKTGTEKQRAAAQFAALSAHHTIRAARIADDGDPIREVAQAVYDGVEYAERAAQQGATPEPVVRAVRSDLARLVGIFSADDAPIDQPFDLGPLWDAGCKPLWFRVV
jgi:hypothetical protein